MNATDTIAAFIETRPELANAELHVWHNREESDIGWCASLRVPSAHTLAGDGWDTVELTPGRPVLAWNPTLAATLESLAAMLTEHGARPLALPGAA